MTHSETFLATVETDDFHLASAALQDYIRWFQSAPRTEQDIAAAKELIARGISLTVSRKAHLAEEFMLLSRLVAAYTPSKKIHTWRIQG